MGGKATACHFQLFVRTKSHLAREQRDAVTRNDQHSTNDSDEGLGLRRWTHSALVVTCTDTSLHLETAMAAPPNYMKARASFTLHVPVIEVADVIEDAGSMSVRFRVWAKQNNLQLALMRRICRPSQTMRKQMPDGVEFIAVIPFLNRLRWW